MTGEAFLLLCDRQTRGEIRIHAMGTPTGLPGSWRMVYTDLGIKILEQAELMPAAPQPTQKSKPTPWH